MSKSTLIPNASIGVAEDTEFGSSCRTATEAWAMRFRWTPIVDDAFHSTCVERLMANGQPITPAHIHNICSQVLSPLLYEKCCACSQECDTNVAIGVLVQNLALHARLILKGEEGADQIAHDAISEVLLRCDQIAAPQAFLGYCQVAVINGARRALRMARRTTRVEVSLDAPFANDDSATTLADILPDDHGEPFSLLEINEQREGLWQWLAETAHLSSRERQIVFLRYMADLTPLQIAHRLGISRAAVDTAWSKARHKLSQDSGFIRKLSVLGYHYIETNHD